MGFAADEIPMPPGDPGTLERGINSLEAIHSPAVTNYLVTNGSNERFFAAAWPSGSASAAAGSEAHTLVGLLRTGAKHVDSGAVAMTAYHKVLKGAHDDVKGWHISWDAAENTYNQNTRTLNRTTPPGTREYEDLRETYRSDRSEVQNPIRTKYETTMSDLRKAARKATNATSTLFNETLRPGGASPSSVSDYLLGRLPETQHALDTQAGKDLANDVKKQQAKHPPDYHQIRGDVKQLSNHKNDPYFNNAFVRTLGPSGVLQLPYDIAYGSDKSRSTAQQRRANGNLLRLVADATAGYIASGPAGQKFGEDLRAAARAPFSPPGFDTDSPQIAGHKALGLLLAAGGSWPPGFLAAAANDIYLHERRLVRGGDDDPWNVKNGPKLLRQSFSDRDPGHGDPMINALSALGHNRIAAQKFFLVDNSDAKGANGTVDEDKLHYLIKEKEYGITVQTPRWTYYGDQGRSLGQALEAATLQDGGSTDGTAHVIASTMVDVIGSDLPTDPKHMPKDWHGYLQPPNMRPYTGHILAGYAHDVNTILGGDDHEAHAADFRVGALRATMRDTFLDNGAYEEVSKAAVDDARSRLLQASQSSPTYDGARWAVDHEANIVGHALGAMYGQRGQALMDIASEEDLNTEERKQMYANLGNEVLNVVTGFIPEAATSATVGTGSGNVMSELLDHLMPADAEQQVADSRDQNADSSGAAMSGSIFSADINHDLKGKYDAGHPDDGQYRDDRHDIGRNFAGAFGDEAKSNDTDPDPVKRWSAAEYR